MTDAETKQAIKTYAPLPRGIDAAIADATADSLKAGSPVAIQANSGQVMSAVHGGPTETNQVFIFESRNPDAIGPHEQFVLLKP